MNTPKLTLDFSRLHRRDARRLQRLAKYSMKRFYASWAARHHAKAERYYNAAERALRLQRIAEAR